MSINSMQYLEKSKEQDNTIVKKFLLNGHECDQYIRASRMARNNINPIRRMVEQMNIKPNKDKKLIPLSIGDPTIFGNLKCDSVVTNAIVDSVLSGKFNGYGPAAGYEESRSAIAKYSSCHNYDLTSKDIIITAGCSSALEYCILVLANPGQNILIPKPGFSIYTTFCDASQIMIKYYNLLPDKEWEIDINHFESVIDRDTVAIIINNPSNPCGSVYSRKHLLEILDVAERHKLPIIADEIYHHFTFGESKFEYLASYNANVPILSCSGLTKRFLIPGWRLGWIAIYDNTTRFKEIRQGLADLATRTIGANTLIQGALSTILFDVDEGHFKSTIEVIKKNLEIVDSIVLQIPGLKLVKPSGAMYAMIQVQLDKFPTFKSNKEFIVTMVNEESVFCLPSEVFGLENYFRILLTVPADVMEEACNRIKLYCSRHFEGTIRDGI